MRDVWEHKWGALGGVVRGGCSLLFFITVVSFIVVLYAPYPQGCHNRVQRLQVFHIMIIITTVLLAFERALRGAGEKGEGDDRSFPPPFRLTSHAATELSSRYSTLGKKQLIQYRPRWNTKWQAHPFYHLLQLLRCKATTKAAEERKKTSLFSKIICSYRFWRKKCK